MIKPYQCTGESRYIGLPLGFVFLGVSYVFMGAALSSDSFPFVQKMRWLQLLTQAYAFAFLAVTYYFSKQTPKRSTHLWGQILFSILILGVIVSCLIVFVPPTFTLPSYKTTDKYFRGFNIIFALYLSISTLRTHASKPCPRTILAPIGYILLAFSQYSFLIWSLDLSESAFVGAYILRLTSLLVFLFISYKAFSAHKAKRK